MFIPNWEKEFESLDTSEKKVALSKIVKQITVFRKEIKIEFKFNIKEFIEDIRKGG